MARVAKVKECQYCHAELSRDEVGLSKKLFEPDAKRRKFSCMSCMSEMLEVSVDELKDKIEEFKAEGCKLFG